jgi:hypothetical protein
VRPLVRGIHVSAPGGDVDPARRVLEAVRVSDDGGSAKVHLTERGR